MNKLEFIQQIQERIGLSRKDATDVLDIFVESLAEAMKNGDRIEIRGLCSFYIKDYESYTGRNPKTGKNVQVPGKRLPFFKPGLELKQRVNS